jgi:predicted DNA-binding protein
VVSNDKGKQAQITSYYEPAAAQKLKALSEATGVPQAAYLREALDDLLAKYARKGSKATVRR